MIETGGWTIPDLIEYLASVLRTLQPTEIRRLRRIPAFLKEATTEHSGGKKVPKFKAGDLYEPLDTFRDLGLPIIDWQGKDGQREWDPDSKEGTPSTVWYSCMLTLLSLAVFLFSLGLKRYPPTKVILGIATKDEPQRVIALNYFLDNASPKYMDYTAKAHAGIAFIPAIHKGKRFLAKPLEVFSSPDWQLLDFPILDPSLRNDAASKLKIKAHPSANQLVHLLKVSPPTTKVQACEWFGVLSHQVPCLCNIQSDEILLMFARLPSFSPGQIICNAHCSHC